MPTEEEYFSPNQEWVRGRRRPGYVPTDELFIDPLVQVAGRFDLARAMDLYRNWDLSLTKTLEVVRYADGTLSVSDGQHRQWAAKKKGEPRLYAMVEDGTVQDAIHLFRHQHDRERRLSSIHNLIAGVNEGDPDVLRIQQIVEQNGYRLGRYTSMAGVDITCAEALTAVYFLPNGEEILDRSLRNIRALWKQDADTTRGALVRGFAEFFRKYGDRVVDAELQKKLEFVSIPYLVGQLSAKAAAAYGIPIGSGRGGYKSIAAAIQIAYDVKRTTRRLKPKALDDL